MTGKPVFTDTDVAMLVQAVKDLPLSPPGVRLSDDRRRVIADALVPFGVTNFQPPHRAPQENDRA